MSGALIGKHNRSLYGLILLSLLGLAACNSQPPTPKVPPTLTQSNPTDGAKDVNLDSTLSLVFSQAMDKASVKVSLSPNTELGTGIWNPGNTRLTFDPPQNLTTETYYVLSVSGKDTAGTSLGDKRIRFSTVADVPPPGPTDPAPDMPGNLSAKPGDKSVTLTWSANTEPDLAEYTLYWGTSASELGSSKVIDTSQTSQTIGELTNGTVYFFALSAKDTAGHESPKTEPISATPLAPPAPGDTTPPAMPQGLTATPGDGEISLSWKASTEPDLKGYNLYSGTSADALKPLGFMDKDTTSRMVNGLTNGAVYYFALESEDTTGNKSARTAPISAMPKDSTAPKLLSTLPANGSTDVDPDTTLTLTFSEAMDKASFKVEVKPVANLGSGTWDESSSKLTLDPPANLAPDTTYTFSLEGKDLAGNPLVENKSLTFRTAAPANPPPAVPSNLSVKPQDKAVVVAWSANTEDDLAGYTLFWGTSATNLSNTRALDKSKTSETITALTNGTAYFFALSAKDTSGNQSARTATVSATPIAPPPQPDTTPPAVPRNLAASAGDGEVGLSWQANSEADLKGYNLYSGTSPEALTLVGFVDKSSTSRKVGGLTNAKTYYFVLEAEDTSSNKSARTAPVSAMPKDMTAPKLLSSVPTNGASNVAVDANLSLSFSEAMDKASIKVSTNPPTNLGAGTWDALGTKLTFDPPANLGADTTYTLSLEGKDIAGNGLAEPKSLSFRTAAPPNLPPAVPTNLSAKPADKAVTLAWSANTEPDLASYTLFWGTSATALSNSKTIDKARTTETISGLNNGTAYFFALSAKDTAGYESARTAAVSATPVAPPPPPDTTPPAVPRNLAASASEGEVNLTWQANTEADLKGYNLYSGTAADALKPIAFIDKGSTSRKVTGLNNGTIYYFALDAEDMTGNKSARTVAVSATPKDTTPPKLLSSVPANNATQVDPQIPSISFAFGEPMQTTVQLDCSYDQPTFPATKCGVESTGYFTNPTWSNDRTLSFSRRGDPLTDGATYRLVLSGAKDKAGNTMADTLISFQIKLAPTPPKLVSSFPANGAKNVPNQLEEVRFSFDKSMNPATFKVKCISNTAPCNIDTAEMLGAPTWSDNNRRVSFAPLRKLFELYTYGWMLEGKDTEGLPLANPQVVFTTTDMPVLKSSAPADGSSDVPSGANINLIFNKAMNIESLKAAFSGSVSALDGSTYRPMGIARVDAYTPSQGGYGYTFVPDAPHEYSKVVVWSLSRKATDTYGNPIPQILSGGFRTIRSYTVTIYPDMSMTGYLDRDCDVFGCDTKVNTSSNFRVGFRGRQLGHEFTHVYRGAISFNFNSNTLPANARFIKATLNLQQDSIDGTPFAPDKLTSLAVERVNFGTKLDGDDFSTPGLPCNGQPCAAKLYGPPGPVDGPLDVLNYFWADWHDRATRGYHSHFRLLFANSKPLSGGVHQDQYITYNMNATLTIEYLLQ